MDNEVWFKYDPTHLEEDELNHELNIRNIIGLSSKREETRVLRKLINQEFENPTAAFCLMGKCDPTIETNNGIRALISIQDQIAYAFKTKNDELLLQAKSRTAAWLNRLNRIQSEQVELGDIRRKFDSLFRDNFNDNKFDELARLKDNLEKSELEIKTFTVNDNDDQPIQTPIPFNTDYDQTFMNRRTSLPPSLEIVKGNGRGRGCLKKTQSNSLLNVEDENLNSKNLGSRENISTSSEKFKNASTCTDDLIFSKDNLDLSPPIGIQRDNFSASKFGSNASKSAYFNEERLMLKSNSDKEINSQFSKSNSYSKLVDNSRSNQKPDSFHWSRFHNNQNTRSNQGLLYPPANVSVRHEDSESFYDPNKQVAGISTNQLLNSSKNDMRSVQFENPRISSNDQRNYIGDNLSGRDYDSSNPTVHRDPSNISQSPDDRNNRGIDEIIKWLRLGPNKSVPIYKWDARFSGDGQGYSLNEFIKRVEKFARDENMSHQKLLSQIHRLLDSTARKWYWASVDEWKSWDQFVQTIKLHFLPRNYDFFLKEEIERRLQTQNEPFTSYITDMKILFQKANPPLTEEYKLYIVQKNMLPEYSIPLATHNVTVLGDLIDLCKRIDETRIMMGRRITANQASYFPLVEPSCFPTKNLHSQAPLRKPFPRPVNTLEYSVEAERDPSHDPSGFCYSVGCNSQLNCSFSGFDSRYDSSGVQGHTNYQTDAWPEVPEVAGIAGPPNSANQGPRRSSNLQCFRCEQPGHSHRFCSQPKTFNYCYLCGIKNYTVDNCPKNHPRTRPVHGQYPDQSRQQHSSDQPIAPVQNSGQQVSAIVASSQSYSQNGRSQGNGNVGDN